MRESIQDFLKPNSNAKTNQGTFIPMHPEKYVGDVTKIYFRSGWEFKFLQFCDINDNILRYSSEAVQVPYISPIDRKPHRYYIDMFIEMRCRDGEVVKWLIEIKPSKYTKLPNLPKRQTKKSMDTYNYHKNMSLVNIEKFKAAKYWSEQMGAKFGILEMNRHTEQFSIIEFDETNIEFTDDI